MYRVTLKFGKATYAKTYQNHLELYDELRDVITDLIKPQIQEYEVKTLQSLLIKLVAGEINKAIHSRYIIEKVGSE